MTLIQTLELARYFSPIYVTTDICNSFQDTHTNGQINRQTDRQTDKQTDRQTDRTVTPTAKRKVVNHELSI